MSSTRKVIEMVEKANAPTPASTESDNRVSTTLLAELPQMMVASVRFESWRSSRTRTASWLPALAEISSRSRLRLKIARLRPANIADWAMHNAMPSQIRKVGGADVILSSTHDAAIWFANLPNEKGRGRGRALRILLGE